MTAQNPAPVWRIKVELLDVVPVVWRRFDTYADVKLSQLHYYIQGVMGWELAHLFAFENEHNRGIQISNALRLCDVCRFGGTLSYAYDFGDDWQHLVTVEKVMAKPTRIYPHLVTSTNTCPPNDSGGPWRYAEIRKALAGRSSARKRELVEWLGKSFDDLKAFDIDAARARLAEYVALQWMTREARICGLRMPQLPRVSPDTVPSKHRPTRYKWRPKFGGMDASSNESYSCLPLFQGLGNVDFYQKKYTYIHTCI